MRELVDVLRGRAIPAHVLLHLPAVVAQHVGEPPGRVAGPVPWTTRARLPMGGGPGEENLRWRYQPDESPKRKHAWDRDEAGFLEVAPGQLVAKCPSSVSVDEAQGLLGSAIPWSPRSWRREHPRRLYVVRQGVLYRATPTVPGRSYHGFPEHPSGFPRGARGLKRAILDRARELGCEHELRRWMNW